MLIVHVYVYVKSDSIEDFITATLINAQESLKEPGVAKFDIIQQLDDPQRFILVEIYKNQEAAAKHKETKHYAVWRDKVESMMLEPRKSVKYVNIFPEDGAR